jgi:transposase
VLFVLKEGVSWRAVDAPGVNWQTVYGHFRRWSRSGLWDRIMQALPWRSRHRLNMVDATHIKVHRDGANPAGGQDAQAMGRTKGGLNTKLHALTDALAQPQSLVLTAGQQADVTHAPTLLENAKGTHVLMDRAYDSDALRALIAAQGMKACIPPRKNRNHPATHDVELYKQRHHVENFFEKLKRCRRVATRYDKTASSFMAFVLIACCVLNLRNQF